MNRVVKLVQTEAVTLRRFDHLPDVAHRDPERERAVRYAVSFVEAGSFRVRTTGRWQEISANSLFVTRPGLEFSCAHDEEHPSDTCLSVSYSDEAVEGARSPLTLAGSPMRPLTNRHAFLQRAIRACVPGEEARAEALAGALLWSLSVSARQEARFSDWRRA